MTSYAGLFNNRHRRSGHLFQNRYRSTLCEKGRYFLELVRYIHLQPLRGGVVKSLSELENYPWTGHDALMKDSNDWQERDEVLLLFSSGKEQARQMYADFLKEAVNQGTLEVVRDGYGDGDPSDGRILGSGDFVVKVLKEAGEFREGDVKKVSLQTLCQRISSCFNVAEGELRSPLKKKPVVDAKSIFSYLAIKKMGYSGVEVGDYLNVRGYSAMRLSQKGPEILQANGLALSTFL